MKHKFFAATFVLVICCLVFIFINTRPVHMNIRFNGTAYEQETELDSNITISLEGDQYNKTFQKDSFSGHMSITSNSYPKDYDAITLTFNKKGIATCKLLCNGTEFGSITADKKLERVSIVITNPDYLSSKESTLLAAPATTISQAKAIVKELN